MKTNLNTGKTFIQEQDIIETLSPLEYDLFMWMKGHQGDVITRESLLINVWGFKSLGETRTVDMCVRRLRRKIGADRIRTVYGEGYLMPA